MPFNTQAYVTAFPTQLMAEVSRLVERGLLTPSYLSRLILCIILPASMHLVAAKDRPIDRDNIYNSLLARSFDETRGHFVSNYRTINNSHTMDFQMHHGIEVIELTPRTSNTLRSQYEIFYAPNGADAFEHTLIAYNASKNPNKHHVFWNYPGVAGSAARLMSTEDLVDAGFEQVRRLVERDENPVNPEAITLHGFSLGGGVSAAVALRCYQRGWRVKLKIAQSFSNLAAVFPVQIEEHIQNRHKPWLTSIIASEFIGLSLGIGGAALVATTGLLSSNALALTSYVATFSLQLFALGLKNLIIFLGACIAFPMSFLSPELANLTQQLFTFVGALLAHVVYVVTYWVNQAVALISTYLNTAVNVAGSTAGFGIAVSGFVAGSLVGVFVGALLSLQNFWTNQPHSIPLQPFFQMGLTLACCELDSVHAINKIVEIDERLTRNEENQSLLSNNNRRSSSNRKIVSVSNNQNDPIIRPAASLNNGLGFYAARPKYSANTRCNTSVDSSWYRQGGHDLENITEIRPTRI